MNFYTFVGLQDGIVTTIFLIALVYSMCPWLAGVDIGIFKVPEIYFQYPKFHKALGPVLFVFVLMGFIPAFPARDHISVPPEVSPGEMSDSEFLNVVTRQAFNMEKNLENYLQNSLPAQGRDEKVECVQERLSLFVVASMFKASDIVESYRSIFGQTDSSNDRIENLVQLERATRAHFIVTTSSIDAIILDMGAIGCFIDK